MKIAITSEGNSLSSLMDDRFGRCAFFAVYDNATNETEFYPNPGKDASGGAGPAAVQFVAKLGVKKIVAPEFGGKTIPLLQSLGIEMMTESKKTIEEIIHQL
jgi:predicted Fe-Mo cluster-binding NifX family protein